MKLGHSYLRWSSAEQGNGDSLNRQIEARDRICQRRDITLVEDYIDRGVSAHRGKHRKKGDLKRLIDDIGNTIKPGEFLLIENIDRLSRENPRRAWKQFNDIIDAGVIIITTYNDREYSAKTIDAQPWLMHELLGEMQRAYSESDVKSQRIGRAWERRRRDALTAPTKLSGICPAWMETIRNEKNQPVGFRPIPVRVEIVKEIFRLAASGLGSWGIAKVLNDHKVPTFRDGNKWRSGYVGKIVSCPSALGTYEPKKLIDGRWVKQDPIEGYYGEAIIDPAVWLRANELRQGRDGTEAARKRRGKTMANLFGTRCFCDNCGGVMRYSTYTGKNKDGEKRTPRKYLFCESNRLGNGCDYVRKVNLGWIEETILDHIDVFPLEDLFNDHSRNEEILAIDNKIASVVLKLERLERDADKAKRFMKDAETPDEEKEWRKDHRQTLELMKPVQAEISALRRKKSDLETALASRSDVRVTIERLKAEMNQTDEGERYVIRQKLALLLRTFIDQIRFHEEYITVILHGELMIYWFSLSKPGGAPKKNPMKLIHVVDKRPMIGDPVKGMVPKDALTVTNKVVYKKMMDAAE